LCRGEPATIRDLSKAIQSFTASYDPATYELQIRLNIDPAIVPPEECQFAYWFFRNDRDFAQSCCFSPNTDYLLKVPLENPGINTGRAFLMDLYGNSAQSDQVIISLGRTAPVPQIQVGWSAVRGPAPLSLVADMTGTKADTFLRGVWNSMAFSDEADNPIQTFFIELPGTWAITLRAYDSVNHTADQIVQLVSILPAGLANEPRRRLRRY
jgi:hypothetical protein